VLFLVVLGIIVGFLNVTAKESHNFLVASMALILTTVVPLEVLDSALPGLGIAAKRTVQAIALFVAPAALIVASKAIYRLAKDR